MASLTPEQREKGVIASSAGNHAQGVALAAAKLVSDTCLNLSRKRCFGITVLDGGRLSVGDLSGRLLCGSAAAARNLVRIDRQSVGEGYPIVV